MFAISNPPRNVGRSAISGYNGVVNEHDASRRWIFADKATMADLIRGFIHESWVAELDLDTLELVSGSFVSERFEARENDIIWRVRFPDNWLYVYLLIEFQSTVDQFMALRLMVCVGLLYQQLIAEQQIGAVHCTESLND